MSDQPEPDDDWQEDGQRSADMLGRVLYAGVITFAALAAVAALAAWLGWL